MDAPREMTVQQGLEPNTPQPSTSNGERAPSINDDLGIGRVAAESTSRFLRPDGSFNSRREGLGLLSSLNPFYWLLKLSWPAFFALAAAAFLGVNLVFAGLYALCGADALVATVQSPALQDPFWRSFFFSVETLSTIGYGHIVPFSLVAHALSAAQAFVGLLGVALVTGMVYARFSRPTTRILFSPNALIAPFQGGWAVMFRIINGLKSEIIELDAQVTLSRFEQIDGKRVRHFYQLTLERNHVALFPLAWTLVHPITDASPLWGVTEPELLDSEAELLIVFHGMDDVLFQRVHARGSYKAGDVVWRARFADMYLRDRPGLVAVDVSRLGAFERVA
jgi:inward rectifier potassium channel